MYIVMMTIYKLIKLALINEFPHINHIIIFFHISCTYIPRISDRMYEVFLGPWHLLLRASPFVDCVFPLI